MNETLNKLQESIEEARKRAQDSIAKIFENEQTSSLRYARQDQQFHPASAYGPSNQMDGKITPQMQASISKAEGHILSKKSVRSAEDYGLEGDAASLFQAYSREFLKNGIITAKSAALSHIDDVLKDASIQINKDGSAIITDEKKKIATKVKF